MLNMGGIYIHGRGKNLRPIIIVNVDKLLEHQELFGKDNIDLIYLIFFIMEYVDKFMMIPGRIENFLLIIDCLNIGVFNAPFNLFKRLMSIITDYYQCRSRQIFCLNAGTMFKTVIWKSISVDEDTKGKVVISSKATC